MVVQLAHLCIETAKLEHSEAFYKLLGITRQLKFRNEDKGLVAVYLAIGGNSFLERVKVRAPRLDGTLKHFALEVDDVDATCAHCSPTASPLPTGSMPVSHPDD